MNIVSVVVFGSFLAISLIAEVQPKLGRVTGQRSKAQQQIYNKTGEKEINQSSAMAQSLDTQLDWCRIELFHNTNASELKQQTKQGKNTTP